MAGRIPYSQGVAFIVEGATEKVFYSEYLEHCCRSHEGATLLRVNAVEGLNFEIHQGDGAISLVKFNNVGAITQMTHSADWFLRSCFSRYLSIPWTVFLAYDTDDYNGSITKFHEGDWQRLRNSISEAANEIIDLAASADIEDVMLCDYQGILRFLGLPSSTTLPTGNKGKTRMKKLHRMASLNNPYHEGDRARPLIQSLDMQVIESSAPVPLSRVPEILFGNPN